MKHNMILLSMCLVSLMPLRGMAQDTEPVQVTDDMQAQMKALDLMKEGFSYFNSGDYARAIEKWTESHKVYPSGMAQLNVAQAYVELERFDDARLAIDTARGNQGYLALPLDQSGMIKLQTLEQRIDAREAELEQEKQAALKKARIRECREGRGRLSTLGKGGLIAVGVGGLSMLGTVPFAIKARGQLDDLTPPHTQGRDQYERQVEELESTQRLGKIFLYTGAGVALTGLGVFAFDLTNEEYPYDDCKTLLDSLGQEPSNTSGAQLLLAPGQLNVLIRF